MSIVILSGGTGTPKLLKGFELKKDEISDNIVIVSNTGDDWDFYGLHVSPDVDAVLYLLSGLLDEEKYWGIKNDTYNAIGSLNILQENVWFNLGDKDMGFCLFRTNLISKGYQLTEITDLIRRTLKIPFEVYPMSNDPVQTYFDTVEGRFHLEEYFIKHKNKFQIKSVDYEGANTAKVPNEILNHFKKAKLLIIGPSNPISSIKPILYPDFIKELKKLTCPKIVISPIIGDSAVSGPTSQYLLSQGFDSAPEGILEYYSEVADSFIFHTTDYNEELKKKYPEKKIYFENILFKSDEIVKKMVEKLLSLKNAHELH